MDAARGQLQTAIRLWFEGGDPVAIHTLASAAHEIIHALYRQKGLKGLMFDTPIVKPEYRQKWASSLKAPFNFFKHGRHDEDGAVHEFDTGLSKLILLASGQGLSAIGIPPSMETLALGYWVLFETPGDFGASGETLLQLPKVQMIQQMAAKGREAYFRQFRTAWEAGIIAFGSVNIPSEPPNPSEGPHLGDPSAR